MKNRAIAAVFLFLVYAPVAHALNYYVDRSAGNDSRSGLSPSAAWRTIAKVNAAHFNPGDNILFKRGCQWRETLTVTHGGLESQPLTYGAYGTGALPIISGAEPLGIWTQYSSSVWRVAWSHDPYSIWFITAQGGFIWGHRRQSVADLSAAGADEYDWTYATGFIYARSQEAPNVRYQSVEAAARDYTVLCSAYQALAYVTMRDLELRFAAKQCLKVDVYGGNCWTIDGLTAHHNGVSGEVDMLAISLSGNLHVVRNCTVYEAVGNGITIVLGKGNVIEHNTVYNNHHNQIDIKSPNASSSADANIVRYNHVYLDDNITTHVTGITSYMTGVFTVPVSSAAAPTHIYYNLIHDIYLRGIQANGPADVYIYNNVVWNSCDYDFYINNESNTAWLFNNIAVNTGNAHRILRVFDKRNKIIDYNCWSWNSGVFADVGSYPSFGTWGDYVDITGFDTHSIAADPMFTAPFTDLRLLPDSPCLNAGKDVGLSHDYDGNTVPAQGAADIGAFERPPVVTAPMPAFTARPSIGIPPLEVRFNNVSASGGSPITGYLWAFGDGTAGTEENPAHVYDQFGKYSVSLSATNAVGTSTHTMPDVVHVVEHLPINQPTGRILLTLLVLSTACLRLRKSRTGRKATRKGNASEKSPPETHGPFP